ncbi:hypothetical protein BC567DRAFT_73490 [Phyllosticta citribraziliensis]
MIPNKAMSVSCYQERRDNAREEQAWRIYEASFTCSRLTCFALETGDWRGHSTGDCSESTRCPSCHGRRQASSCSCYRPSFHSKHRINNTTASTIPTLAPWSRLPTRPTWAQPYHLRTRSIDNCVQPASFSPLTPHQYAAPNPCP